MTVSRTPEGYKNIGDAAELGDCYNVVASLADLPAPVGGVRTLPANTATLICGVITLPAGEKVVVPNDAILTGRDADLDGVLGDRVTRSPSRFKTLRTEQTWSLRTPVSVFLVPPD